MSDRAPDVVDELRAGCAEVARRARSVHVRSDVIAGYARSLPRIEPLAVAGGAGPVDGPGPADSFARAERAAYWLTLDAINFGSGWFPTLRKDPGSSGYATIASAWASHWRREGPLSAVQLTALSSGDVAAILGQDRGHELMELYALSLRDLGAHLIADFGASAPELVAGAGGSAVALAGELGSWPCFADRCAYEELSIPFLKRAQIVAADLQRAGVVGWQDGERLTMFADNLVPHVLRLDGVLRFADVLVTAIDAGELIAHGSPEEVEIRACALHAVELIVAARHELGDGACTAAVIDQLLWTRGGAPPYKAHPRHRSRCTAY